MHLYYFPLYIIFVFILEQFTSLKGIIFLLYDEISFIYPLFPIENPLYPAQNTVCRRLKAYTIAEVLNEKGPSQNELRQSFLQLRVITDTAGCLFSC